MSAVTVGEVRVESVARIDAIEEIRMEIKKNSHAFIHIEGIIPEEEGDSILFRPLLQEKLRVWIGEEVLFNGRIAGIHIQREGNVYEVSLDGISATQILDGEKRNRTFQNTGSTYHEVMEEVLGNTSGTGLIFMPEDMPIGMPLYQIEETDWEFVCRLASHLSAGIFASVLSEGIKIYAGLPSGKVWNGDKADIVRQRAYMDKENRCLCLDIVSYENWKIGDWLEWQEKRYAIIEKNCCLKGGLLCFGYKISQRRAAAVRKYGNPYHGGLLLPAKVLDVKEEAIRVCFEMDKAQKPEEAYWYPWRPETGNLMYCMPEKGERVYIKLGNCEGQNAAAVYGVHGNGKGNLEMKPENRYFTTTDGKRMSLLTDSLAFQDLRQTEQLEVRLDDNAGISLTSNKGMLVSAKENIGLKGENIFIQAPQELSIVRRNVFSPTVINMCNGFDSVGVTNEVTMAGAGDARFPVFHDAEEDTEEGYSLNGIERDIIASTPGAGFVTRLERQIGAAVVNRVIEE